MKKNYGLFKIRNFFSTKNNLKEKFSENTHTFYSQSSIDGNQNWQHGIFFWLRHIEIRSIQK